MSASAETQVNDGGVAHGHVDDALLKGIGNETHELVGYLLPLTQAGASFVIALPFSM